MEITDICVDICEKISRQNPPLGPGGNNYCFPLPGLTGCGHGGGQRAIMAELRRYVPPSSQSKYLTRGWVSCMDFADGPDGDAKTKRYYVCNMCWPTGEATPEPGGAGVYAASGLFAVKRHFENSHEGTSIDHDPQQFEMGSGKPCRGGQLKFQHRGGGGKFNDLQMRNSHLAHALCFSIMGLRPFTHYGDEPFQNFMSFVTRGAYDGGSPSTAKRSVEKIYKSVFQRVLKDTIEEIVAAVPCGKVSATVDHWKSLKKIKDLIPGFFWGDILFQFQVLSKKI